MAKHRGREIRHWSHHNPDVAASSEHADCTSENGTTLTRLEFSHFEEFNHDGQSFAGIKLDRSKVFEFLGPLIAITETKREKVLILQPSG